MKTSQLLDDSRDTNTEAKTYLAKTRPDMAIACLSVYIYIGPAGRQVDHP